MKTCDYVTEDHIRAYREDGVCCIRSVFTEDEIDRLRKAVAGQMASPRATANFAGGENGSGRFFTDTNMWRDDPEFRIVSCGEKAAAIAAEVMGSGKINLYNEHLLVKEPGSTGSPTPWHQDQPYFRTAGWQVCSLWIALDKVNQENGAMSFVKGSHKWNKMFQPVSFTSARRASADDFDGPAPDIDGHREDYEIVTYELEPGDLTVHHGLTLHGAPGNSSGTAWRRGLSLRYTGDDVTFIERSWHPTTIDTGLKPGEPIDCDMFPVIWRQGPVDLTV